VWERQCLEIGPVGDTRVAETGAGLRVPLHVQPRARRNEIAGYHNGALKVRLTAPPVEDAANRALLEFFASRLDLPKSRLSIVSGSKSRNKVLRIEGITLAEFLARLDLPVAGCGLRIGD
jgi:uncharacterized protein